MIRFPFVWLALLGATAALGADPSLHDATNWPLVAPEPGAAQTVPRLDLEIGSAGDRALRLDAWLPHDLEPTSRRPAVVFLGGPADSPEEPMRRWPIYRSWMQAAAARGLVGVMADVEPANLEASHSALFRFLAERGPTIGVDPSRLAIVALSGNVPAALSIAMADSAPVGLRAAVFLYGAGAAPRFRTDLPVLYLVAGKDAPGLLGAEDSLFERAQSARAPWIFVHALDLPHAFDALDTSTNARVLVSLAVDFLEEQLAPPSADSREPEASTRAGLAALYGRDFERAREIYERLASESDSSDPLLWKNLAWAREGSGDAAGTLAALDRALALDPHDRACLRAAGFAAARLSDWARAEKSLVELGAAADASALEILGLARLRLNRPADAVQPLASSVAATGRPETRYNYACALARSGDRDGALRELSRAVADGYLGIGLATDPDLESLHDDARFQELVRNLPQFESDSGSPPPH